MAGVEKIMKGKGIPWENLSAVDTKRKMPEGKRESPSIPSTDRLEYTEEWTDMEWEDAVKKTLDSLKAQYPPIHILIDEGNNKDNFQALAAGLGKGSHLVISREFLERMGSGAEEFAKCSSVLMGMAKKLTGIQQGNIASGVYIGKDEAKAWVVKEKKEELKKDEDQSWIFNSLMKKDKDVEDLKRKMMVHASFNVSRHYSRLAGARSKGQVQTVMSDVQRSIGNLQMTAMFGEDEEKIKASRALRSLKKLLARGGRKIGRLNRQQLVELRKKRAEKRQEERKAEAARLELKKRRAASAGADNSLAKEGVADESYIRGYRHYRRLSQYSLDRIPGETLPMEPIQTVGGDIGGAGAGGFAPSDVTMTETISF